MHKITRFFTERPLLVNFLVIAVFVLGIRSYFASPKEAFPNISRNVVIISTLYPGASAKDVELNVTIKIEESLDEVVGVSKISSTSSEGVSRIIVEADDDMGAVEFRRFYNDVDAALSTIDDFPSDLDGKPVLNDVTSNDRPIIEVAFTGDYEKLRTIVPFIERRLRKIPSVSYIDTVGLPDQEVQILVDPDKAKEKMVDLGLIYQAIQKRNIEGSGGTLESFVGEKKIVSFNKYDNYNEVLDTNIIMSPDGYGTKLKDVASLSIKPEERNLLVRNNGKRGATLSVKKKARADIIKTINAIRKEIAANDLPDGVEVYLLNDASLFTRSRLEVLTGNALIGFILVTLILLLIFDFKTALWTAFGIPFSLMGLFIYLRLIGFSVNLVSLAGFIIVIGMLVDDAIVIAEEINANRERGLKGSEAAIAAVKHMWVPVVGAVLTTMVAFTPLLSIGGLPGKFLWIIPAMVCVALSVSLFESFFILPSHLMHSAVKKIDKKKFVVTLENVYRNLLGGIVKFRYIILIFFVFLFIFALASIRFYLPKEPFPQSGAEAFNITMSWPSGYSLEKSEVEIKKIEAVLDTLPGEELSGYMSRVGTLEEATSVDRGTQSNSAVIFVFLTQFVERKRTAFEIMDDVRAKIEALPSGKPESYAITLERMGPPMGKGIEIEVSSNTDEKRDSKVKKITDFLSKIDGIQDVETNEKDGKEELNLKIDHDMLSRTGLTSEDVLRAIRIAFDGQGVTSIVQNNKEIEFRLRLNEKGRADENFISRLPILNRNGNLIKIEKFIKLKKQPSTAQIFHTDSMRTVTITANVKEGKTAPQKVMKKVKMKFPSNDEVHVNLGGQAVESKKLFGDLGVSAAFAILGVFFIVALIFNSVTKPAIIMLTLPFAIVGVVLSMLVHGLPVSAMGGMAAVGIIGIVVNDSIVMVHTIIEQIKEKGKSIDVVIEASVSRLRPVMLTTVTTFLGVIPTGYGIGGYDPMLSDMCLILGWGLVFGTTTLLILVPSFYAIGFDISKIFYSKSIS